MSNLVASGAAAMDCANTDETARGVGYLARQPILDRRGAVFGYELHFHDLPGQAPADGLSAASRGMLDSLALYGVQRFTGGVWGFVPCSLDVLAGALLEGLPPSLVVLEVPRCPEVSPPLLQQCRRLREMGFRLALSDFEPDDERHALLPLAHYIKVGVSAIDSPGWIRICSALHHSNAILIADGVHSHDAYRRARAGGLRYFQGYYFCHPELFPRGTVPTDRAHYLGILRELFKDPLDHKTLCPEVRRDPSLVFRVLRFVNSPLCAVRDPITSMETAIVLLGDTTFRRIATLAIQCGLNQDHPPELLRMAQVRAHFCSRAAELCSLDAEEMYLLGLLSLLPAMLRVPMETILPDLPLRSEIRHALAGTQVAGAQVKERCLLSWLEALETNDIAACEAVAATHALDNKRIAEIYLNAVEEVARDAMLS